jgi:hypothetical protein
VTAKGQNKRRFEDHKKADHGSIQEKMVVSTSRRYVDTFSRHTRAMPAPPVGTTFLEALTHLKQRHDTLCVARQREDDRALPNPAATYKRKNRERLIVVWAQRPQCS